MKFQNAGPGHSLRTTNINIANNNNDNDNNNSDTNNNNNNNATNPNELRARRLAALEQRTNTTTTNASSTTSTIEPNSNSNGGDQADHYDGGGGTTTTTVRIPPPPPQSQSSGRIHHQTPSIQSTLSSFHDLMWDTATTTPADQERWFYQGIHTPLLLEYSSSSSAAAATSIASTSSNRPTFEESHSAWGLTQSHGGPCGILAPIQAEMIRVLKKRRRGGSGSAAAASASSSTGETPSVEEVREALAESMGFILARAASMPRVGGRGETNDDGVGRVVLVVPKEVEGKEGGGGLSLTWEMMKMEQQEEEKEGEGTGGNDRLQCVTIDGSIGEEEGDDIIMRTDGLMEVKDGDTKRDERIQRLTRATSRYLLSSTNDTAAAGSIGSGRNLLEYFYGPGGVLMFTMSLVASRGVERIRSDMDNPHSSYLTAQFGMTGQEMINLLITGQAVSNVFDNTISLGGGGDATTANNNNNDDDDDLKCHGIQSQPSIGYLSQLESLRYCEVGGYYKAPKCPIWVVGSTSHFSVLFGEENSLKESKSDELLERCRRAFKSVEGGEENGFVGVDALGLVLDKLDLQLGLEDGSNGVQSLAASLEVSGAGIILWDDFWKAASRLLTGASLESVLQREGPVNMPTQIDVVNEANDNTLDSSNSVPMAITQFGEGQHSSEQQQGNVAHSASLPSSRMESDEELAKRLAAEWETDDVQVWQNETTSGQGVTNATGSKSDEELARELQAQWNADEDDGNEGSSGINNDISSTAAVNPKSESDDMELSPINENFGVNFDGENPQKSTAASKVNPDESPGPTPMFEDQTTNEIQPYDFEQFGESFQLHHYNGLRGGLLTSFRVTRLSSQEAVGASVALSTNAQGASAALSTGQAGSGGGDLEDVVRTKYPSCTFNWGGRSPPSID